MRHKNLSCNFVFLCVLLGPVFSYSSFAQGLQFQEQAFQVPEESEQMLVADLNGDRLNDLLVVLPESLRVYFQQPQGFNFDTGFEELSFAGQAVGWDVTSGYTEDEGLSLIALIDGEKVVAWHGVEEKMVGPVAISTDMGGFLNQGLNRLHFSQDINRDGFEDLIIPGAGKLQIHINNQGSGYQAPLEVQSDFRIRTNLESSNLERRIGQAIRIPMMELRDVNSDGAADLVSRTEEKLDVFLASQSGNAYFPATPSYSLDIAEIEARLGEFDIENLDFSNLTGVLALTHEEILEDIDGDGIDDLMLREAGKVSVFGGTKTGMAFDQPRQILRSGGNVLSTFLYDENEDSLKDLWLWRVEPISVSDIFVWLALSGSIAVEAFIYPNEGDKFARRPARKLSVNLKFPSVMRLVSNYGGIRDELERAAPADTLVSSSGEFNNQPSQADLVALVDQQLLFFLDSIAPEQNAQFMGALGYSRDKDNYEIDIKSILDDALAELDQTRTSIDSQEAGQAINLSADISAEEIITARINGDSTDDILIFESQIGGQIRGLLLLSSE